MVEPWGIEPQLKACKASTLPLCYGPKHQLRDSMSFDRGPTGLLKNTDWVLFVSFSLKCQLRRWVAVTSLKIVLKQLTYETVSTFKGQAVSSYIVSKKGLLEAADIRLRCDITLANYMDASLFCL